MVRRQSDRARRDSCSQIGERLASGGQDGIAPEAGLQLAEHRFFQQALYGGERAHHGFRLGVWVGVWVWHGSYPKQETENSKLEIRRKQKNRQPFSWGGRRARTNTD
jgi:hypothetical protein